MCAGQHCAGSRECPEQYSKLHDKGIRGNIIIVAVVTFIVPTNVMCTVVPLGLSHAVAVQPQHEQPERV